MHFLTNLRLAVGTAAEHFTDDPALLLLHISRLLPARLVQPTARLVSSCAGKESYSSSALLTGLMSGEEQEVAGRLEAALLRGRLSANQARALADVSLVANRPDLDDAFLARATEARRFRAAQARRFWYSGAMTPAVEILENAGGGAERRQGRRLAAELRILEGWRPEPAAVPFEPVPRHALDVLTNSLPHTASGYAHRSHSILLAKKQARWETLAVTRVGYPVKVGKLKARNRDVVGATYQRLLPSRLSATMDGRLQHQVEEVLAIALEFRPSVLHTTSHHVNALVTRAVAEVIGIPWVYEVSGHLADTWAATGGAEARGSERYTLFQERETEAMLSADLVVTLGRAVKDNIVADGVPEEKVLVALNAVGGAFLAEPLPPAEARVQLGLDPKGQYVGTVSSLVTVSSVVTYEGINDLTSAFGILAPRHPRLKLLIVGGGVALPSLKEQARTAGLRERIIFAGRVSRSRAHVSHQALEVFVVPRRDLRVTGSVTPLKPVPALACARPFIASKLPALQEVVSDGTNGLLCNAEDQADLAARLEMLLADSQQRVRMGRNGRRTVLKTRTWTSSAQAVGAAYERILERFR
ncbi:glycosyltransferase family 4 protein [Arthrobacter pascens]|uniref:glycosyltransferase family 4 protein n=1 Tax=Arthrobacter pascens TaxID=1677 RepID=UPI0027D90FDA|nr:glycosyltransferase family 4 protein [Arthrobacter pascens]